jgi:FdhD protein
MLNQQSFKCRVTRVVGTQGTLDVDFLATEEPLEIRLSWIEAGIRRQQTIAVTMRTPGHDEELAAGFLAGEGIITCSEEIQSVEGNNNASNASEANLVTVNLVDGVRPNVERLERHFYTSSSCGVCGKTSMNALGMAGAETLQAVKLQISAVTVVTLPIRLKEQQEIFQSTGGLHAAALYSPLNNEFIVREDVGRHNAVDKLVGHQLLRGANVDHPSVLVLSGRASFELVQKAVMAHLPIIAAVGAPSSLAVKLAAGYGVTLLGFVRGERFNVYSHPHRIGLEGLCQEKT